MIIDEHMARGSVQTRTVAFRAGLAIQKLREFLAHGARLGFPVAPVEVGKNALEAMPLAHLHAAGILVKEIYLVTAAAVEDDLLQFVV